MLKSRLLIVDDDKKFAAKLAGVLEGLFSVDTCHSESEFLERFVIGRYDLLIMDIRLNNNREGLDLLKEVLSQDPMQAAIVMTAYADTETYADAIGSGALTYLDKREFSPALIARTIEALVEQSVLKKRLAALEQSLVMSEPREIIGISLGIKNVGERIRRAAEDGDMPILIVGEPGSGKELSARNIHRLNHRRVNGPFVHVRRDHLKSTSTLGLPSGLSRDVKGTNTLDFKGWIYNARGGILFIDEASGLDASEGLALAQFIETHTFNQQGGRERVESDVQVIVSIRTSDSNALFLDNIRKAIGSRGGIEIKIPPLRERREDIPLLAQYTLQRLYQLGRTQARSFRSSSLAALESQPWAGNVRELKGAIEYASVRADMAGVREIGLEHLPYIELKGPTIPTFSSATLDYQTYLARAELGLVESAIEQFDTTKKSLLAKRLNYNDRFTFTRRMQRNLVLYPILRQEFPRTAALFADNNAWKPRSGGSSRKLNG